MNQRIKELAKQAGLSYLYDYDADGHAMVCSEKDIKKFAELIVRECIDCCEQVISDPVPESVDTWLNGGEQCIQEIKEHFGII